jgi:cathepsin A (carboxypeptidase C)
MELGPCRIAPEGGFTVENEFGWNANATLLFVEFVHLPSHIEHRVSEVLTHSQASPSL